MSPLFFNLVNAIGNLEWSTIFFFLNVQLVGLEFQDEREKINYLNVICSISKNCILQNAT